MATKTYALSRAQFDCFRHSGARIRRKRGLFEAVGDAFVTFEGNTYPATLDHAWWGDGGWIYALLLPRKAAK